MLKSIAVTTIAGITYDNSAPMLASTSAEGKGVTHLDGLKWSKAVLGDKSTAKELQGQSMGFEAILLYRFIYNNPLIIDNGSVL